MVSLFLSSLFLHAYVCAFLVRVCRNFGNVLWDYAFLCTQNTKHTHTLIQMVGRAECDEHHVFFLLPNQLKCKQTENEIFKCWCYRSTGQYMSALHMLYTHFILGLIQWCNLNFICVRFGSVRRIYYIFQANMGETDCRKEQLWKVTAAAKHTFIFR